AFTRGAAAATGIKSATSAVRFAGQVRSSAVRLPLPQTTGQTVDSRGMRSSWLARLRPALRSGNIRGATVPRGAQESASNGDGRLRTDPRRADARAAPGTHGGLTADPARRVPAVLPRRRAVGCDRARAVAPRAARRVGTAGRARPAGLAPARDALRFCRRDGRRLPRSEEHTSELQSRENLVCR